MSTGNGKPVMIPRWRQEEHQEEELQGADRPDTVRTAIRATDVDDTQVHVSQNVAATVASFDLPADGIITDPAPYLRQLKAFMEAGKYREGAEMGDALFTILEGQCVEDPDNVEKEIALMSVIEAASMMAHVSIHGGGREVCERWVKRAGSVRDRMGTKRVQIETREGAADFPLRLQLLIAELKMRLQQIRLEWKTGQEFLHGQDQENSTRAALSHCEGILRQDIILSRPEPDAGPNQRRMAEELNGSLEYRAEVLNASLAKGVMLGLSYVWNLDYQMRDMDVAEKSLSLSPKYVEVLKEAAAAIGAFVAFYQQHRELARPPSFGFACLELIRYKKMLGKFDEAMKLIQMLRKPRHEGGDTLFSSRLANGAAEVSCILAQRLLACDEKTPEYEKLMRQGQFVAGVDEPIEKRELAVRLLRTGRTDAHIARDMTDDTSAQRNSQGTLMDVAMTVMENDLEDEMETFGRKDSKRFVREIWSAFKPELMQRDDDSWIFWEAPFLARFWILAQQKGRRLSPDIFSMTRREDFEKSLEGLRQESRHDRRLVPRQYSTALAQKIRWVEELLR